MNRPRILVADDEKVIRQLFERALRKKDYAVQTVSSGTEALLRTKESFFNLLILDLKMPGKNGVEVLKEIKRINPYIEVIIITGYPVIDSAVEAIKIGAFDFICKPFDMEKVYLTIEKCLEVQKYNINHIQLGELKTFFELNKTAVSTTNIDPFLGRILDLALETTKARKGSLLMLNKKTKDLHVKVARGLEKKRIFDARIGIGEGISGKVAKEGKPILIANINDDCRFREENIPRWEAEAFLDKPLASIPLNSQRDVLGVINVADKVSGDSFTEREQIMLSVLAGLAAAAIENARLYGQLRSKVRRLRQTITRLNQTQNQLIQIEKMSAAGKLIFDIAHEIRTPLSVILGGVELLGSTLPRKDRLVDEYVQKIKRSVKRANNIIVNFLKFSRSSEFKTRTINVCDLLEGTVALIKSQANLNNVKIIRSFSRKNARIRADQSMLRQVFFNLFINAIDAMPRGGKLVLDVHRQRGEGPGRNRVIVKVADTGIGIPEDKLPKIFDPFVTTKEPGKGTGLGLSIVQLILKRHNATIRVESKLNRGTSFIISFPAVRDERSRSRRVKSSNREG